MPPPGSPASCSRSTAVLPPGSFAWQRIFPPNRSGVVPLVPHHGIPDSSCHRRTRSGPMSKVLLIDPALAVAVNRFRQILPASVEIAVTTSFENEEFAQLAADAEILINARRRI